MRLEHTASIGYTEVRNPRYRRAAIALGAAARFVLLALIRFYQVGVRPLLIGSCKFYPTCSEYGAEAIGTHGARRGLLLSVRRVVRCHPFSRGGIDPVPPARSRRSDAAADSPGIDGPTVDAPVRVG